MCVCWLVVGIIVLLLACFPEQCCRGKRESEVVVVVCDADSGSEVCSKESWGKVGLCIPRTFG